LAALLGLGGLVAGRIALHRKVILLEGAVALPVAAVCLAVVAGILSPSIGLAVALAVLLPYLVLLGVRESRLRRVPLPPAWAKWLARAGTEEGFEHAIHPRRAGASDVVLAVIAVFAVVGASVAMRHWPRRTRPVTGWPPR
jgi:hypothetical protein